MEWKDLNKTAPIDVLINMEKYQIQLLSSNEGWRDTQIEDEVELFEKINNRFLQYRYRLKPLEPIRIIRKLNDLMFHGELNGAIFEDGIMKKFDGRKVEIID